MNKSLKRELKEYAILIPLAMVCVSLGWPHSVWGWVVFVTIFIIFMVLKLKRGPVREWFER